MHVQHVHAHCDYLVEWGACAYGLLARLVHNCVIRPASIWIPGHLLIYHLLQMCVCQCVCVCVHVCAYVCIYVCAFVRVCVCTHV